MFARASTTRCICWRPSRNTSRERNSSFACERRGVRRIGEKPTTGTPISRKWRPSDAPGATSAEYSPRPVRACEKSRIHPQSRKPINNPSFCSDDMLMVNEVPKKANKSIYSYCNLTGMCEYLCTVL